MSVSMALNGWGSAVAFAGSLAFIVVYAVLAPWWRTTIGRLLMAKAVAICGVTGITLCALASGADTSVLRVIRGLLVGSVGLAMLRQAVLVLTETWKGRKKNDPHDDDHDPAVTR